MLSLYIDAQFLMKNSLIKAFFFLFTICCIILFMKKSYKKFKIFLILSSSFVLFSTVSSSLISCNTNSDMHHIIFNESNDFEIVGINSDGYKKGDKISFSINVLNINKEIEKVLKDNVALELVSTYTFTMPNNDVNIEVILKDKEIGKECKVVC